MKKYIFQCSTLTAIVAADCAEDAVHFINRDLQDNGLGLIRFDTDDAEELPEEMYGTLAVFYMDQSTEE